MDSVEYYKETAEPEKEGRPVSNLCGVDNAERSFLPG